MSRLHPTDLTGRRVWWLLDLSWGGQTIRMSDAELDVLQADGTSLHYAGVLEGVDVDEGIDFLADASSVPVSASLAAVLPVNVPRLVALGHDLAGATGVLSRWIEGTTWESRRVVVNGQIVDPEYGAADEPTSFTLELTPWDDSQTVPAPGLEVAGANWDTAMLASLSTAGLGLAYPVVIGRPGQVSSSVWASGLITGSQAAYVDQRRTLHTSGGHFREVTPLLAGHHVTAESVYLRTPTDTSPLRYRVSNTYDRNRHPVAVATWWYTKSPASTDDFEYDGSASYTWNQPTATVIGSVGHVAAPASVQPSSGTDPVGTYVTWVDDDNPNAGGLAADDGTAMREAGDVLQWLLSQSGIPVDRGRFAAARRLLLPYRLDFSIDAQVTPWEYARAHLLPILPVSIVSGPDGLYPVVWRYDATAADSVCALDTGIDPRLERASMVSYDRGSIANDLTLRYALAVRTGEYLGTLRYGPSDDSDATPNLYCELSQRRYSRPDGSRLRSARTIESPCIYSDQTAHAVLQWMSAAYALARRRVDYIAPETGYGWLERGQVVTITDADLYLTAQVAIVEAIQTDGSAMIRLRLLLIESPARDSRLVS